MIYLIVLALIFAILPYFLAKGTKQLGIDKVFSDVVVCYLLGIIIGNTKPLWLQGEDNAQLVHHFAENTAGFSVLICIPMLLMITNMIDMIRNIRPVMFCFTICVLCVIGSTLFNAWLYRDLIADYNQVAGAWSGVYIGGTPNLIAIGKALEIKAETMVIIQGTDMLCSGIYVVFLTSIAQYVFNLFLRPYPNNVIYQDMPNELVGIAKGEESNNNAPYEEQASSFLTPERLKSLGIAITAAIVMIGISIGAGLLFPNEEGKLNQIVLLLVLSTLGILSSLLPLFNRLVGIDKVANYLLLIFAISAGSMADFATVIDKGGWYLAMNASIVAIAVSLHTIGSKLFRIDTDTTLVSATASIFGPAFIPQVCAAIKNKHLLSAGMAAGIAGFLIANYIGFMVYAITSNY